MKERAYTVAVVQMACGPERAGNVERAEAWVREAARRGADLVLLPELFEGPYFGVERDPSWQERAEPLASSELVAHFRALAAELGVVLPLSLYERDGVDFYNSLALLDADGSLAGIYRKAHIPSGPGYEETFYFQPGDTGFRTFPTSCGRLGPAICWDQWFPETARALVLNGAEMLLYPSAIGSEPEDDSLDSQPAWRAAMCGHAACNLVPVLASNRVGTERGAEAVVTFYGSSFIADERGRVVAGLGREESGVALARFDLGAIARARGEWGILADRRPDLYGALTREE